MKGTNPNPDKPEPRNFKKLNFLKNIAMPLYKRFCGHDNKFFCHFCKNFTLKGLKHAFEIFPLHATGNFPMRD